MDQAEIQAEEDFGRELGRYADQWVAVGDRSVVKHHPELSELLGNLTDAERTSLEVFRVSVHPFI
jgi:Family of unknown function (DUF5678)